MGRGRAKLQELVASEVNVCTPAQKREQEKKKQKSDAVLSRKILKPRGCRFRHIKELMQRGFLIFTTSLYPRLSRCCYLAALRSISPFWVGTKCTMIQHRRDCTINVPREFPVVYDPKPDMSEEEVKHIKLEPVPEELSNRRRFALLLSFSGQGFGGMQRNMMGNSIENCLHQAMFEAGLITEEELQMPQLFSFQRTSRTDKGVSAARLLVVGNFSDCDKSELKEKLNQHMSNQIRVMAVFKTTKNFNCRTWCDARSYSYTCPTFAFASVTKVTEDNYRLSEDALEEVRRLFAEYKGRHNFHNFTKGIKPHDPRAVRCVLDIECGEPFEQNGLQWITIRIKGISFLLHQIRKMVGLVIAIRRGHASTDFISHALSENYACLPIAPGLGLVLEDQLFINYNKKFASDGTHEALTWESEADAIEEFFRKKIIAPIMDTEMRERSMLKWLPILHCHYYEIYESSEKDRDDGWLSDNTPRLVLLCRHVQHHKVIGGSVYDAVASMSGSDEGELGSGSTAVAVGSSYDGGSGT